MLATIQELYVKLLRTLTIQLESLPDTFFTVDLAGTGLQDFLREELEALFRSIMRGHSSSKIHLQIPIGIAHEPHFSIAS
jgi:hypothetical protein